MATIDTAPFWTRLAAAFRLVVRERVASFFVAAVAIGVGGGLFADGWRRRGDEVAENAQALNRLITRRMPGGQADEHLMILAAALELVPSSDPCAVSTPDGRPNSACRFLTTAHDVAVQLGPVLGQSGPPSGAQVESALAAVRSVVLANSCALADAARIRESWEAIASRMTRDLDLERCNRIYGRIEDGRPKDSEGARCLRSRADATLLVPDRAFAVSTERELQNELRPSWIVPVVASAILSNQYCTSEDDEDGDPFRLVQLYYISRSGALRIQERDPAFNPYRSLPSHKLWSDASYIAPFFADDSKEIVSTPSPYLDQAGHGLVSTSCVGVRERDSRRFIGALCADIAVEPVLPKNDTVVPFGFGTIRVARSPDGHLEGSSARLDELTDHLDDGLVNRRLDPDEVKVQLLAELQTLTASAPSLKAAMTKVNELSVSGAVVFGLSLRCTHKEVCDLLLVHAIRQHGIPWAVVVGAGSLVFGAAILLYLTLTRSREEEVTRNETVLQNLHVGVAVAKVGLGDHCVLVNGNDRAEEILGEHLPAFSSRDRLEQHWDQVFEPTVWPAAGDREGRLVPSELDRPLVLKDLLADRRRGRQSAYFTRLLLSARKSRWVLIYGAPLIAGAPHDDQVESFVTFELVTDVEVLKLLEAVEAQWKSSLSSPRQSRTS